MMLREYHRGNLTALINVSSARTSDVDVEETAQNLQGGIHRSLLSSTTSLLRAAFLPEGFPESVSPDYLGFQMWDTIQALSSYVRGVLTSQAILRGVGVGEQASTPLAAVFTFFVRDLAGMLGGILFAYLEGSSFDACAKQWRLFADIVNDLGMTVELASPLFPRAMFLPIACLGSIARSLTGVAGGATRAALTQHFAQRGNAADVSAKEQSQETATTILGMVVGLVVTRLLAADRAGDAGTSAPAAASSAAVWAWVVFLALTVLHVVANVAAMRVLLLTSLNMPRLELLLARYLRDGQVLSPSAVSKLEDLTPPPFRRLLDFLSGAPWRRRVHLHYGSRLSTVLRAADEAVGGVTAGGAPSLRQPQQQGSTSRLERLLRRQGGQPYLLFTVTIQSPPPPRSGADTTASAAAVAAGGLASSFGRAQSCTHVHLVLKQDATPPELLRAFVHAHCLAHFCHLQAQGTLPLQQLRPPQQPPKAPFATTTSRRGGALQQQPTGVQEDGYGYETQGGVEGAAEAAAEAWMAAGYGKLYSELQAAGWHTDRVALPRPSWTADWGSAEGPRGPADEDSGHLHQD